MNFGKALEELKSGGKVCRSGWNGKGMYLYEVTQDLNYPPLDDGEWKDGVFPQSEFLVMKTADNKLIPWLASQTDVLAEDWEVLS